MSKNSVDAAAEAWFASLTPVDGALAEAARRELPGVQRRALARTLLALGREGLLPIVPEEGDFSCALPDGAGTLHVQGFIGSFVLLRSDLRSLRLVWKDGTDEVVDHPARLLDVVAKSTDGDQAPWERLAVEVSDSVLNEALALAAHARTDEQVRNRLQGDDNSGLRGVLRALGPAPDGALFLDQWAATGHPLHTVPKTRLGLSPAEALGLLPEFHPVVLVRLAAVRRDRTSAELPADVHSQGDWFAAHYPGWFEAWRERLEAQGEDAAAWAPFPVHPWQAERVLPSLLSEALARGEVGLLDGPALPMHPCLSVRSLVPGDDPNGAGFKLALGLRLTSGVRTITPRSCHMGPRVSRLLRGLFETDAGFGGRAAGLEETLGAHYHGADGGQDAQKHLSFIVRESVSDHLGPGEIASPVAALAEPFPGDGPPLLLGLMTPPGSGPIDGLTVFETYAEAFLGVVLRTYLVYGIALEAHGQNVLACFDERGGLTKFLFRDFAGIRIHEPTLRRLGLELEVHPDRRTVVQGFDDHRFWLRHRAYHCHLGHIAHSLALATGVSERRFWQCAGDATARVFEQLKGQGDPAHWAQERRVLLDDDWDAKGSLSMRLVNQVRDLPFSAPNPFRSPGADK